MTQKFHILTLAAFVTMAGAMGAAAATIDFTDEGSYTISDDLATGTTDGIGWTLDSNPADSRLRYTQEFDGDAAPVTPLALENDGIGVSLRLPDDEVSFPSESLTMTFDATANVTGFYFLDLFGDETVDIYDENNVLLTTVTAASADGDNSVGGYTYWAFDASVTSLTFVPGPLNDSVGRPDYALAGVDLAAVPVPAAGLLLLTALAGLGLARRRKSA
jgi:hypothetical protein